MRIKNFTASQKRIISSIGLDPENYGCITNRDLPNDLSELHIRHKITNESDIILYNRRAPYSTARRCSA